MMTRRRNNAARLRECAAVLAFLVVMGFLTILYRLPDIDSDKELREKYDDEVPVVFMDGRKAFQYRMEMGAFLPALEKRSRG